ncbi:membrane protein [Bacteroidia bacterium]|nr:membrane protein [Bacteroidia bacterium]
MNTPIKLLGTIATCVWMVGSALFAGILLRVWENTEGLERLGIFLVALVAVFSFILSVQQVGRTIGRQQDSHTSSHGAEFALLVATVGVLLLCFNADILPEMWKGIFFSWPMLFFVIGSALVGQRDFLAGIAVLLGASFFLVPKVLYDGQALYYPFISTYWPLLLVLLGIVLFCNILFYKKFGSRHGHIFRKFGSRHEHIFRSKNSCTCPDCNCTEENKDGCTCPNCDCTEENRGGKINYHCTCSGIGQVILDPVFKGGSLSATLGGIELDLRQTTLPEGETRLHIKTVLGGIEITAPLDWHIEVVHGRTILGGVYDSRPKTGTVDMSRKLLVVVDCILGGVNIQ